MKRLFVLLIMVLSILSGCRGPQVISVPLHDSTSVIATEAITDNPTWTDPESILYQFAFECDSAYNVILKKYNELNTGLKNDVKISEKIVYREDKSKVNRLTVDISVLVDSLQVQNRTIERLKNEKHYVEKLIPVDKPVPFTPKWKNVCMVGFFILLLINALLIYLRIKK
jgi:hypothetical protein